MGRPTVQHDRGMPTVETPLTGIDSTYPGSPALAAALRPGDVVGEFTIVALLGAGGGGRVYEARQDFPSRSVALKVVASGHLTAGVASRFRFEAEVLGRLRHPGIAQVYAAGVCEAHGGLAWIAMELVPRGRPLTAHATAQGLGVRQRVETMVAVCDAVAHAHGRGVLHHDLKPGNVLVDEAGLPRLIDFGIALPIDGSGADRPRTLLTAGTPAYMSPEQFAATLDDLDVRAEVYALGVMLYELLADRLPYDVGDGGILEVARVIGSDAPRPLPAAIPGPLRGITHKALARDRERRYASVAELAADLRRFLDGDPVLAVPPTAGESLRRLIRRHRAGAAAVAFSSVAAVAALVGISWFAIDASRQRDVARSRLAEAERSRTFMLDTLAALDPGYEGPSLTTADILMRMVDRAGDSGDEATRAAVLLTLGRGLIGVGKPAAAAAVLDEALELHARVSGEAAPETRLAIESARRAHSLNGDRPRTRQLWERELAWYDRCREQSPGQMVTFLFKMADWTCYDPTAHDRAITLARRAAALADEDADPATRASGQLGLAGILLAAGRVSEAAALIDAVTAGLLEVGSPAVSATARVGLLQRAGTTLRRIDPTRALELQDLALAECARVHGSDDPRTLAARHLRVSALAAISGRTDETFAARLALHADQHRILGPDHRDTIGTQCELAAAHAAAGRLAEAIAIRRDVLDRRRRLLGPDQPVTISSMLSLARLLAAAGDVEEALRLAEDVASRRIKLYGADHAHSREAAAVVAALRAGERPPR